MAGPAEPRPTRDHDLRRPRDLLTDPVVLLALLVLVVNDHLLKGPGPAALTGKLSDAAGLFAFPLAAWATADVLRARRAPAGPGLLAALCVLTGGLFAALKLFEPARAAFEGAYGVLGLRARVTPDATDLLCLPAVALAWRHGVAAPGEASPRRSCARRAGASRWRRRGRRLARAAALGAFWTATVATSVPPARAILHHERDPLLTSWEAGVEVASAEVVLRPEPTLLFGLDHEVAVEVGLRWPETLDRPRGVRSLLALLAAEPWRADPEGVRLQDLGDGYLRLTAVLESDRGEAVGPLGDLQAMRLVLDLADGRRLELLVPLRRPPAGAREARDTAEATRWPRPTGRPPPGGAEAARPARGR